MKVSNEKVRLLMAEALMSENWTLPRVALGCELIEKAGIAVRVFTPDYANGFVARAVVASGEHRAMGGVSAPQDDENAAIKEALAHLVDRVWLKLHPVKVESAHPKAAEAARSILTLAEDMAEPKRCSCMLRWLHCQCNRNLSAEKEPEKTSAPRVTMDDIEANITSEHYFTAENGVNGELESRGENYRLGAGTSLSLLTFCVLVLKNGFTVTGESACASPENFDAALGRQIARKKAVEKVWPLLGYELRTKLAAEKPEDEDSIYAKVDDSIFDEKARDEAANHQFDAMRYCVHGLADAEVKDLSARALRGMCESVNETIASALATGHAKAGHTHEAWPFFSAPASGHKHEVGPGPIGHRPETHEADAKA